MEDKCDEASTKRNVKLRTSRAGTAKKLVPRRYPALSGRKTVPSCHFSGRMVLISQMGRHGSSIAIAVVDTYMQEI